MTTLLPALKKLTERFNTKCWVRPLLFIFYQFITGSFCVKSKCKRYFRNTRISFYSSNCAKDFERNLWLRNKQLKLITISESSGSDSESDFEYLAAITAPIAQIPFTILRRNVEHDQVRYSNAWEEQILFLICK